MAEIATLSVTDASNTTRFYENQAASSLNDGARALEGMLARALKDTIDGALTTGGTSTAYTLTPNRTVASYYDGLTLCVKFHTASGATPTINVSLLGAKSLNWPNGVAVGPTELATDSRYLIQYNGTAFLILASAPASGTVTSVALTVPTFLSVTGSPVTSSGTLAVTAANQAANTVLAGPTSGSAAAPTFRALVAADITPPSLLIYEDQKSDGTVGGTATTGSWTKHDLGTEVVDAGGYGSVSSNVITLAAGTYEVLTETMAGGLTGGFRTRWRDTTNSATYALSLTASGGGTSTYTADFLVTGRDRFTISGSTAFELQYFAQASGGTFALGQHDQVTAGVEIYARVTLVKIA